MPDQDPKGRRGKSLVELTKRFLRLLQESEGGILDLKKVKAQVSFHHCDLKHAWELCLFSIPIRDKIS